MRTPDREPWRELARLLLEHEDLFPADEDRSPRIMYYALSDACVDARDPVQDALRADAEIIRGLAQQLEADDLDLTEICHRAGLPMGREREILLGDDADENA